MKFRVEYENGEESIVDCKCTEPFGDFSPPDVGLSICCKVKGTKYQATILELVEVC